MSHQSELHLNYPSAPLAVKDGYSLFPPILSVEELVSQDALPIHIEAGSILDQVRGPGRKGGGKEASESLQGEGGVETKIFLRKLFY